jgi:hypothetical protein
MKSSHRFKLAALALGCASLTPFVSGVESSVEQQDLEQKNFEFYKERVSKVFNFKSHLMKEHIEMKKTSDVNSLSFKKDEAAFSFFLDMQKKINDCVTPQELFNIPFNICFSAMINAYIHQSGSLSNKLFGENVEWRKKIGFNINAFNCPSTKKSDSAKYSSPMDISSIDGASYTHNSIGSICCDLMLFYNFDEYKMTDAPDMLVLGKKEYLRFVLSNDIEKYEYIRSHFNCKDFFNYIDSRITDLQSITRKKVGDCFFGFIKEQEIFEDRDTCAEKVFAKVIRENNIESHDSFEEIVRF